MKIKLEQVFYGRGSLGYAILGSTQCGSSFAAEVQELSEVIGAPAGNDSFTPFLVSKPYRGHVIMMRVCRGEPDSGGRGTVFFHALIGASEELAEANVDAFTLDARGLFTDKVMQDVEPLMVESEAPVSKSSSPSFCVEFPAAVHSAAPDSGLVKSLIGADVLRRSWATFSFHPMKGFDLYLFGADAPLPSNVRCYNQDGEMISRAASIPSVPTVRTNAAADRRSGSGLLKFSLLLNAVLAISCWIFFVKGSGGDKSNDSALAEVQSDNAELRERNVHLEMELKNCDASALRGVVIKELREKFVGEYHGTQKDVLNPAKYGKKDREDYDPYVKFVNNEILDGTTKDN